MAITIIKEPTSGKSIWLPLIHHVSSNVSIDKFVFDIYYKNSSGVLTYLTRKKVAPTPGTLTAVIDVSKTIQSLLTDYWLPTQSLLSWASDGIGVSYVINYGYESGGTITMPYPAISWVGSYIRVYNIMPRGYFDDNYTFGNISSFSLLSNRGKKEAADYNYNIHISKYGFATIPFHNQYYGSASTDSIDIRFYIIMDGGSSYDDFGIIYTTQKELLQVNIGKSFLESTYGVSFDTIGNFNHIDIVITNLDNSETTATWSVYYDCVKDNAYNITFLNAEGGYETVTFNSVNREVMNMERKQYKQTGINTANTTDDYRFSHPSGEQGYLRIKNRQETIFSTTQNMSMKLQSGWVDEDEHKWLRELIFSKDVWIGTAYPNTTAANLFPCQIKTSEWSQKLNCVDKMFNLELEINLGQLVC